MTWTQRHRIGWVVLIGVIGFLAGLVGGLFGMIVAFPDPVIGDGIVRRQPRVGDDAPAPALAPIAAAVVDHFAVRGTGPLPATIPLAQRTGRGVAITNDGWVATVRSVLPERAGDRPIIVTHQRRMHEVDRIAYDPISDLVFLHAPSLDVAVLPLREHAGLRAGMSLYAPTADGGIATVALRSRFARFPEPSNVRSSDRWDAALALDAGITLAPGTPLVDRDGAIVGIVADDALAYPVEALASALPSLFARGAVVRNTLGISYRVLAEFAIGPSVPDDGIVIARPPGSATPFAPQSPLAGIVREGDRLLAIGDDALTAQRSLAVIAQEYPIGGEIRIRVIPARQADANVIGVTLRERSGEALLVLSQEE